MGKSPFYIKLFHQVVGANRLKQFCKSYIIILHIAKGGKPVRHSFPV
jgi:hypothetical protein